ncbi:hypothetical protein [Paenibacillus sp. BJ-4]|uniref:hypothetical protein n=1 Tax=Paenibacillus sp. BJ-4 TaxID=2878097 RepID=UPI001CEFD562|nr:hypothetical protein [Paenibacillus sp. BJ-4]
MVLRMPKSLQTFPKGAIKNAQINQRFPAIGITEFRIDVHTLGNMLICFDAEKEISFVASGEKHLLPQRICSGGTFLFEGSNLGSYWKQGQNQKIFIEVHVPLETNVQAKFTAGVLVLDGGRGTINVEGTFGEVAGITESSNVQIKLSTGDVSMNELRGDADIRLTGGSATLGWTELTGRERINVHCGTGGIDIFLPAIETTVLDQGFLPRAKRITTHTGSEISGVIGIGTFDIKHWQ